MVSPLFSNEEVNMLHALRSRSTDCKANFKQKYIQSNLLCPLCKLETEDQQHMMKCSVLMSHLKSNEMVEGTVEYKDIYSIRVKKQKVITVFYIQLFKLKENILENISHMAPSPACAELKMSNNLHSCTACSFSGK